MKAYQGYRAASGCVVTVHERREGSKAVESRPLDPRLDLRNHSPTGFEWGYLGSGPAQLALALAADALGDDEIALRVYQELKTRVTARLVHQQWKVTQAFLRDVIEQILDDQMNPTKAKEQGVH